MKSFAIGIFSLSFDYYLNPQLTITAKIDGKEKTVLDTASLSRSSPFLQAAKGIVLQPPILNGNYQLQEQYLENSITSSQTIDNFYTSANSVTFEGSLTSNILTSYDYSFSFSTESSTGNQLRFSCNITNSASNRKEALDIDRLLFSFNSHSDEQFFGFGESFSFVNLKGQNVPILVSEQGVGRGVEPLTSYLNENVAEGVGGHWYTTYAPKPIYLTNYNNSLMLHNAEISFFNLTQDNSVTISVWSSSMSGHLMTGSNWFDLIEAITSHTGRPAGTLPAWSQSGAVVGLEGGTDNVTAIVRRLKQAGVPVAGVWLQDWVGLRHYWEGDRLIWNWELNYDWYPGWHEMTAIWAADGTRVLTYISPFFADPTDPSSSNPPPRNNYFQQGIANGYFVKNSTGQPYVMSSLSIRFCMLDPTNPEAVEWMKSIIVDSVINEAGSSGWMCDFGEYLPFDAVLFNGVSAASYHNIYPQVWAQLTREAIDSLKADQRQQKHPALQDKDVSAEDILFFMRSAWIESPSVVDIFWLGDQLTSWDGYDGLASVVTGALSSGLTGHAITHSDIGGYNVEYNLGDDMYFVRTPELLKRWSELAAFGSGLFRTHIGSSTTALNAQIYDTDDSMQHFGRFAAIFGQLSSYRQSLMETAAQFGYPLMRPMVLHYAYDANLWLSTASQGVVEQQQQKQYLFGPDFLVAPVLRSGDTAVVVYFPSHSGPWIHLWSGNVIESSEKGFNLTVPAGVGFPFVAFLNSSEFGHSLRAFIRANGYSNGYNWTYPEVAEPSGKPSSDEMIQNVYHFFGVLIPVLIIVFLTCMWCGEFYPSRRSDVGSERLSESPRQSSKMDPQEYGTGANRETESAAERLWRYCFGSSIQNDFRDVEEAEGLVKRESVKMMTEHATAAPQSGNNLDAAATTNPMHPVTRCEDSSAVEDVLFSSATKATEQAAEGTPVASTAAATAAPVPARVVHKKAKKRYSPPPVSRVVPSDADDEEDAEVLSAKKAESVNDSDRFSKPKPTSPAAPLTGLNPPMENKPVHSREGRRDNSPSSSYQRVDNTQAAKRKTSRDGGSGISGAEDGGTGSGGRDSETKKSGGERKSDGKNWVDNVTL